MIGYEDYEHEDKIVVGCGYLARDAFLRWCTKRAAAGHAPAAWKSVMGLIANHAALVAPMQAMTEISLGILLVVGLLTRPVAFVAFLFLGSLWVSEWGTSWIWELLVPALASVGLAVGRAGRTWGIDAFLAQRRPWSPWW